MAFSGRLQTDPVDAINAQLDALEQTRSSTHSSNRPPAAKKGGVCPTVQDGGDACPAVKDGGDAGRRSQLFSGHAEDIKFNGHWLMKKFQSGGRGEREARALQTLSSDSRWSPFVPSFEGIVEDYQQHGGLWLKMQNLTSGMDRPVVLDMKVGTRHYSPGEGEVKVAKELKKAATTTIGTLGLRVVGCKVPSQDYTSTETKGYKVKNECEDPREVLLGYLRTPARKQTAKEFVDALSRLFATQRDFVFMASSILFVYDATLGDQAPLFVKMIDFGHMHTMQEMRDEASAAGKIAEFEPLDKSYIKALDSLSNCLL